MITSLNQLQSFLLNQADEEKVYTFKKNYLMTNAIINKQDLNELRKKNIKLPESYLKIILLYKINGILIGNFSLSPYFYTNDDIIKDLLEAHEDSFYPKEFMNKHNMYQIGSYEADTLCVTNGTDYCKEGEIFIILYNGDIYNPQDNQIKRLARDFEQFLIVAGNLSQI